MFIPVALVLSFVFPLSASREANITVPPRAVNSSINEFVEFKCTAVANEIYWGKNGLQLQNGTNGVYISPTLAVNSQEDIRTSTLKIMVTSTDDAGNITCYAYAYTIQSLSIENSTALLLVQGQLEPAHNLSVAVINSTTVLISWSPPFTLEGVPILGYNVTIIDTTSGENETLSVEGDNTMLYYSIDHPDPDHNFTVTMICINKAGPGENSSMTFLMSMNPMVSTLQVIRSMSVMSSTFISSNITTPMISSTTSHSASPAPFRPDNKSGTIIGVSVIIVAVVVAVSCISVVVYCKRKQKKQEYTADENKKFSELDTTDYEDQNETEDAEDEDAEDKETHPLLRSKSYPEESEHTPSVFNSLQNQLPEMKSEMQDVLNEAMQIIIK